MNDFSLCQVAELLLTTNVTSRASDVPAFYKQPNYQAKWRNCCELPAYLKKLIIFKTPCFILLNIFKSIFYNFEEKSSVYKSGLKRGSCNKRYLFSHVTRNGPNVLERIKRNNSVFD